MIVAAREVLLVDDDETDRLVMEEALKGGQGLIDLKTVGDAASALRYLRGEGPFAGAARPALVLLDLNLLGGSGLEVLREMKGDPALQSIPVLVLSNSDSQRHIDAAYAAGANCYLAKPAGFEQLRTLAGLLGGFWLLYARLPSAPERG